MFSLGDEILCRNDQEYSPVIGFSHKDESIVTKFREVKLDSGNVLRATHGHYVYKQTESKELDLVLMGDVKIGDSMILGNGSESRVVNVKDVMDHGLYNPHTACGDIVVNGIMVSSYTVTIKPFGAHAVLAPLRASLYANLDARFTALLTDQGAGLGRWLLAKI